MIVIKVLLILITIIYGVKCGPKPIQYADGKYWDIVVSIHPDVSESYDFISNLKELLRNASAFLFSATNGKARFDSIEVIVPQNWTTKTEYKSITTSVWTDSHIRIAPINQIYSDKPFTFQPRGCGQPGEYIQLSDTFVKELNGITKDTYGYPDKLLVKEWSKYRYGAFDELGNAGDYRYPAFYMTDGKIYPTACVSGIKGLPEDMNGNDCKLYSGGIVDHNCNFIVDTTHDSSMASIMSFPLLESIEMFCENNTIDTKLIHNYYAPNEHNIQCSYRSARNVIEEHQDFRNLNVNTLSGTYLEPNITLSQIEKTNTNLFILVLDISGSMDLYWRGFLNTMVNHFVNDVIIDGMQLGIIAFTGDALILHPIVTIDSISRQSLADIIPQNSSGDTSIDKGLQLAIDTLQDTGRAHGATIILMTDGIDNYNFTDNTDNYIYNLNNASIKVDSITISGASDPILMTIADKTGGKYYHVADGSSTAIDTYFLNFITQERSVDNQLVMITNREAISIGDTTVSRKITIDPQLGKNTKFSVYCNEVNAIDVTFKSPSGNYLISNNQTNDKYKELLINDSEVGEWEIFLNKVNVGYPFYDLMAELTVTSEPKHPNQQPIRVNAFLGHSEITYPSSALIYTQLYKCYQPVIGAEVVAVVERPTGDKVEINLYDDGAGPDIRANDGVYTTAFTQFTDNGRYSVVAKIAYIASKTRLRKTPENQSTYSMSNTMANTSKSEFQIKDFITLSVKEPEEDIEWKAIEEFSRGADVGAFKVDGIIANNDLLPPGRVTDLRAVIVDESNDPIVELRWTAPGDDSYTGKVTKTDLRVSLTPKTLYTQELFDSNDAIDERQLVTGSLEPQEGHTIMSASFPIPRSLLKSANTPKISIYFGLRAIDDDNNLGDVSNIAFINVKPNNSSDCQTSVVQISHSVLIFHNTIRMIPTNLKNQTIVEIPEDLGRNTTFTITSNGINLLNITITSPNGTVYGMASNEAVYSPLDKSAVFNIPLDINGKWSVGLEKKLLGTVVADVSVTSGSRVDEPFK